MDTTQTFKHQKVQLRKDGIDPSVVSDRLFLLEGGRYQLLDAAAYQRLSQGRARL